MDAVEMADKPPDFPTTEEIDRNRLQALRARSRELTACLRVLAVVSERLLAAIGGESVIVSDEDQMKGPDLHAVYDEPNAQVVIVVSR